MSKLTSSPLRWITPGQLAICVVLFFLPWIEIQCGVPDLGNLANPGNIGNFDNPAKAAKPDLKVTSWRPLFTQTGLEAATGEYTIADPDLRAFMDKGKQAARDAGVQPNARAKGEDKPKTAPLLWGYLIAAVVGVVLGLILPSGGLRKVLLILCCAIALVAAGGQAAAGFPIEQDIKEQKGKAKGNDFGNPGGEEFIRARYKIPFYLALLFATGALVTALAEPMRSAARTKKPIYDFDEEPDDGMAEAEPLPDEPPRA